MTDFSQCFGKISNIDLRRWNVGRCGVIPIAVDDLFLVYARPLSFRKHGFVSIERLKAIKILKKQKDVPGFLPIPAPLESGTYLQGMIGMHCNIEDKCFSFFDGGGYQNVTLLEVLDDGIVIGNKDGKEKTLPYSKIAVIEQV